MGRRTLLLALLVPALAACAVPGTDAADMEECEEAVADLWTPPDDAENWDERVHHLCEGLVEAGLDDSSSDSEFLAVLRDNPAITGEMCELSTEALFIGDPDVLVESTGGYVTRDDVIRLGRDSCTYAITGSYGSPGLSPDLPALFRAHPYLVAPFCRAPLMQAYDQERPPQPRKVYEEVVTDACMEGIRTGVVDYSSNNVLHPDIDQRGFRKLLNAEWIKRS